jgi:hypothetical protein
MERNLALLTEGQVAMIIGCSLRTLEEFLTRRPKAQKFAKEPVTRSLNVNDFEKSPKRSEHDRQPCAATLDEKQMLVNEILGVCGDRRSLRFYGLLAERVPHEFIRAALTDTRVAVAARQIRKSAGAFFTDEIKRIASVRGIDLGLKPDDAVDRGVDQRMNVTTKESRNECEHVELKRP